MRQVRGGRDAMTTDWEWLYREEKDLHAKTQADLAAERKRREEAESDAQRECDGRLAAVTRAEQAERERDEARRALETAQAMADKWPAEVAARERAEADNAAIVKDIQTRMKKCGCTAWGPDNICNWCDALSTAVDGTDGTSHPGAAMLDRMRALEDFARGFAEMAETCINHHEGPKTGMRVPYHGDFANLPPSGVSALKRWWKSALDALKVPHE